MSASSSSYELPASHTTAPDRAPDEGIPWSRYLSAIWRQKWFVLVIAALGSFGGLTLSRFVQPMYEAHASILVNTSGAGQNGGPIRAGSVLQQNAWIELFRSYSLADSVVTALHLYVAPELRADSLLFRDFDHAERFTTGAFVLRIDSASHRYHLLDAAGVVRDSGGVADSIGRPLGFRWSPPREVLASRREVRFRLVKPRDASNALINRLVASLPEDGSFLRLQLSGSDPQTTALTLNTWSAQFVAQAEALKKRNLVEFLRILESQLVVAETEMRNAEIALESFRVNTITLPSEGTPMSAGVEATRDPVMNSYFRQKSDYDDLRHDREALEQVLAQNDGPTPEALLSVPGVVNSSPGLQAAISDLTAKQAQLRAARATLTDAHPTVRALSEAVRVLQKETIPSLSQSLLAQLRRRENDMGSRIAGASAELKRIPPRTIEELRLRRQVAVSEHLYNTLKSRYEEAKLAEAGATPDVSVFDFAEAPQRPSSNGAPRVVLLAVVTSVALAILVVLILDRLDRRFRYPTQATYDLGLTIAGAVPRLRRRRDGDVDVDLMSRTVEAFRTLRLAIRYRFAPHDPIALTVTSPGAADGKSIISSNLALSFANAGYRTLLIDGDVRRGRLHNTFDVKRTPGLVDLLEAGVDTHFDSLVRAVPSTQNLWLIPCGSHNEYAPELLGSAQALRLVERARERFDVVLIDSPPLSAGVDAYALGVAAGSVLVVLRAGATDRKLAEAKLQVLDRLPVRVLGAVLNDIGESGEYRYYGYKYEKQPAQTGRRAPVRIPTPAAAAVGSDR